MTDTSRVTVLLQRHQKAQKVEGLPDDKQDKNDIGQPGCDRSLATGALIGHVYKLDSFDLVLGSPAFRAINTIVHTAKGATGMYPAIRTEWEFGDGSMTSNPVTKEEMARAKAAFEEDKTHTMEYYLMNDPEIAEKLMIRGRYACDRLHAHLDAKPDAETIAIGTHGAGNCEPICGIFERLEARDIPEFAPGDFAILYLEERHHDVGENCLGQIDHEWVLAEPIRYFHVTDVEGGTVAINEVPFDAEAVRQRRVLDMIE